MLEDGTSAETVGFRFDGEMTEMITPGHIGTWGREQPPGSPDTLRIVNFNGWKPHGYWGSRLPGIGKVDRCDRRRREVGKWMNHCRGSSGFGIDAGISPKATWTPPSPGRQPSRRSRIGVPDPENGQPYPRQPTGDQTDAHALL